MKIEKGFTALKSPWVIIIITVLLVTSVLVLGNQTYKATEKATFDEFNQRQLVLGKEATTGIELYFEGMARDMRALGKLSGVQRFEEANARIELQHRLEELEPFGLNDIGVLDADGVIRYTAVAHQLEGIDFSWRKYYQEAKEMTSSDTYIIEFIEFKGVKAGERGVLVAVPMFVTGTGEFAGVIVGTIELNTITQKFVAPIKSSERGHAFLIDDEYNVLWSPDRSLFGKNLWEEGEGFPAFQQIVERMRAGNSGTAEYSYYIYDDSAGEYTTEKEEKLIAYLPINLGKETWAIGISAPQEEARKLIYSAFLKLQVLVGLAILIILLGSSYGIAMSSRVSKILEREVEIKTSELKRSEEKYRTLVESSSDCICYIDLEGKFIYMNPGGVKLNELESSDELLSRKCTTGIKEEYIDLMEDAVKRAKEGMTTSLEYKSTTAKGRDLWWESIVGPIKDDKGNVVSIIRISRDITGRKRTEEQIKSTLREKESLLQEIHHRVKNNMQIISSLLKLQSKHIKDKRDLEVFKESQDRIKTMSLVHEKLYQSKDLANIEFGGYIKNLANGLFRTYGVDADKITLQIDVEGIPLRVDVAIPTGLIINELVSNSLKHAFPDARKGEIEITIHQNDKDEIELVVSDDGIGIPEDLDFRNTKTLGLHLVTTLVKQLKGEIELNRTKGTKFQIKFKGGE